MLFSLFSAFFKLDLRTQKQCYEKILAIISSVSSGQKLHFVYLIFLIMLETKDPVLFKEYFSFGKEGHEKKELIKTKFSSFYNIRIRERLYYALDFVDFYSVHAYTDHDGISEAIKRRRHSSSEVRLLESIRDNQNNMKQYEKWVLLACNLE